GDAERDHQLLAASADRKLQVSQAAFGASECSPPKKDAFPDPPLYRDFLRLDDGILLEVIRDPDLDGRIRFIHWEPSAICDSQASVAEDQPAAPESQPESQPVQITYVDHLPVIHGGESFTLLSLGARTEVASRPTCTLIGSGKQ